MRARQFEDDPAGKFVSRRDTAPAALNGVETFASPALAPEAIQHLQRSAGNRAVSALLAQRSGPTPFGWIPKTQRPASMEQLSLQRSHARTEMASRPSVHTMAVTVQRSPGPKNRVRQEVIDLVTEVNNRFARYLRRYRALGITSPRKLGRFAAAALELDLQALFGNVVQASYDFEGGKHTVDVSFENDRLDIELKKSMYAVREKQHEVHMETAWSRKRTYVIVTEHGFEVYEPVDLKRTPDQLKSLRSRTQQLKNSALRRVSAPSVKPGGSGGGGRAGGKGSRKSSGNDSSIGGSTSVKAAVGKLASGVAINIFTSYFHDKMLKNIRDMPVPKIDKRRAKDYFADPRTRRSMRIVDLLHKNLRPFIDELQEHHATVSATVNIELALLAALAASNTDTDLRAVLERLGRIEDELEKYERALYKAFDNVVAALDLEARSLKAAKAAGSLRDMIDNVVVADYLLKLGFSFDELVAMWRSLNHFAHGIPETFKDLKDLHRVLRRLMDDVSTAAKEVNVISWRERWVLFAPPP